MTIDRFQHDKPFRVLVFTSAKAGSGKSREQIPRLLQMLEALSVDCLLVHTVDELQQQVSAANGTHGVVVVAAGGDGTISLAASLVGNDIPVVPMPLGTENLLARQFGHVSTAESVVETIRYGTIYQLDAGVANGRSFLIMATCGFDAEVVRALHLTRRGHIRRLSYLRPILRALKKYDFPKITVRIDDGETIECGWAMVFNLPRYGAGLGIEPDALGNDGLLNIIAFQGRSIPTGLKYIANISLGQHLRLRDVVRRRGQTIEISTPEATSRSPVPFQLDGDYAGRLPLKIETKPHRVQLLLPPKE